MNDSPIAGLDTLPVPDPSPEFWAQVHDQLLAVPAVTHPDGEVAEVEIVHHISSRTVWHSGTRRMLAAAAVLALVIGGLVVFRLVRPDAQTPATRTDVTVTDPLRIDLDGLRREQFGWQPDASGPYQVFEFPALSTSDWVIDSNGHDVRDTRAVWDYIWMAQMIMANDQTAWEVVVRAPATATLTLPSGGPITVRGVAGVVTTDSLVWIERGVQVTLRWMIDGRGFDPQAGVQLADGFEASALDEFNRVIESPGSDDRPANVALAGTIDGSSWWLDETLRYIPGADLYVVRDGNFVTGGSAATSPLRAPVGWHGVVYAGRVAGDLVEARLILSDGTMVTLPVHDEGDTTIYAAPVPVGLDAVELQLVGSGGGVESIRIPPFDPSPPITV